MTLCSLSRLSLSQLSLHYRANLPTVNARMERLHSATTGPTQPDRCTGNLLGPLLARLGARKQNFWEWNMLVRSVGEVHSL